MRPQWEIDAIDAAEDAREARAFFRRMTNFLVASKSPAKTKKGRGQRRNRRNRQRDCMLTTKEEL